MYKKIFLVVLLVLLCSCMVVAGIISQKVIDKEIENTIKDNELAQAGATTGYSFPTNYGKETSKYECSKCVCECDD